MKPITFQLKEKSRANRVYIVANFEGGDGDTSHPEEYLLPFPFSEWEQNLELIEKEVKDFGILKDILDSYDDTSYEDILAEHGREIANMYECVPRDPQTDYDRLCYLSSIELVGYDNECNMYKAWL